MSDVGVGEVPISAAEKGDQHVGEGEGEGVGGEGVGGEGGGGEGGGGEAEGPCISLPQSSDLGYRFFP
jgi:hypothetical protein